jgi:hypothetical protein
MAKAPLSVFWSIQRIIYRLRNLGARPGPQPVHKCTVRGMTVENKYILSKFSNNRSNYICRIICSKYLSETQTKDIWMTGLPQLLSEAHYDRVVIGLKCHFFPHLPSQKLGITRLQLLLKFKSLTEARKTIDNLLRRRLYNLFGENFTDSIKKLLLL